MTFTALVRSKGAGAFQMSETYTHRLIDFPANGWSNPEVFLAFKPFALLGESSQKLLLFMISSCGGVSGQTNKHTYILGDILLL